MQLKSLARTQSVLANVNNVQNAVNQYEALKNIGRTYTTETLKAALAQSTFNQTQIAVILSGNGLRGSIRKTTVEKLVNAASTHAVAEEQKKTAASTLGLGTAFKGLGYKIKSVTAALWAFLTTNPVGWLTLVAGAFAAAAFGVKKYNDHTDADAAMKSHLLCPCFYPRNLPPLFTPESYQPRTVSAADHGPCFVRIREGKTSRP